MFLLRLNPMRANAEANNVVARAETKDALVRWVESERVESYRDEQWRKCFRQGGPLEWYNPPEENGELFFPTIQDIGTLGDHLRRAEENWYRAMNEIPSV